MHKVLLTFICLPFMVACGNHPLDNLVDKYVPYTECVAAARKAGDADMNKAGRDITRNGFDGEFSRLNKIEMEMLAQKIDEHMEKFTQISLQEMNEVYKSDFCQKLTNKKQPSN